MMGRIINQLLRGDVSLLVLSGMASQVINLAAYPLLTQAYSPASFGAFSVITALAMFTGAAILLRFDAIIQIVGPDDEDDILAAAAVVGLGFTLAVMAVLLVFGKWLFAHVAADQEWRTLYALVVPALALMNGLFALSRQYFAKITRYRRISAANFLRTLVMVSTQLVLVFSLPGPVGLIAGFALGLVLALVLAWPLSSPILARILVQPLQALRNARGAIHRHRAYIRVDVVNVLIAASVLSIYPIIVLFGFGSEEAGLFAVASRLIFIPVDVLGASISTVFFQRFSLAVRAGEGTAPLFLKTLAGASATAAVIAVLVWLLSYPFVRFFFPPEWLRVSQVMILLLPTFAVRFIISCIGSTPLALSRPRILFVWNIVQVATIGATWVVTIDRTLDLFLLASGFGLMIAGTVYSAVLWDAIRRHMTGQLVK